MIARFRRWYRYQRHLNYLINERMDAGYGVSAATMERYRAEARRAAGY